MNITRTQYLAIRSELAIGPEKILQVEKAYMKSLLELLEETAGSISVDFTENANALTPFWKNYPPEQRGNQPTGQSVPWLDLGEKTVSEHVVSVLRRKFPDVSFPGLPTGGDIRFATGDVLIHLDIKLTGPNDNPDEIVVPPNQVSGDGVNWRRGGLVNSQWPIYYQARRGGKLNYHFHPKLPPFYILKDCTMLCLTFFLKVVYTVRSFGAQPLRHFELISVPNGLLMFDGPKYGNTNGLIIPGKDEAKKREDTKRIRIRLDPLAQVADWRCIKVEGTGNAWQTRCRSSGQQPSFI